MINGRCQFLDRGLALAVGDRWSSPRSARSPFFSQKTGFIGIMCRRQFGFFDGFTNECVVAVRELVSALIAVERGRNGPNVDGLSCPSVVPVIVSGQYLYIG